MRPFTFALMLLAQRSDEALRLERGRPRRDPQQLSLLRQRKRQVSSRLRRSLLKPPLAEG